MLYFFSVKPLELILNPLPSDDYIALGSAVMMTCEITNRSSLHITEPVKLALYKDGKANGNDQTGNVFQIIISNMNESDIGIYECRAVISTNLISELVFLETINLKSNQHEMGVSSEFKDVRAIIHTEFLKEHEQLEILHVFTIKVL